MRPAVLTDGLEEIPNKSVFLHDSVPSPPGVGPTGRRLDLEPFFYF
jgi:hypothetical protein